jgi:hypothetical protein
MLNPRNGHPIQHGRTRPRPQRQEHHDARLSARINLHRAIARPCAAIGVSRALRGMASPQCNKPLAAIPSSKVPITANPGDPGLPC